MKKILKRYGYLFIAGIIPFLILLIVYYLKDATPFGDHSLLTIDFFHQYGPMLGELFDRIKNGSSLIYSFSMGMGQPFFLNFFNYLSSPFNIVIFLFKRSDLLMSYSFIVAIKVIFSSINMAILFNYKFKRKYIFIPLCILYAFNAYFVAYYWNIMWLDGLVFLPLIILGIEKLIKENKCLLYCLSLAITLYSNFFMGYMICIFSVLYFIAFLFINTNSFNWKDVFAKVRNFFVYSLIAGGLCAFFLIPLYFSLKGISATGDVFPTSQYYDFTLKEFIFNHFSGVGSTVLKSGITCAPNISCGILCLALFFVFLINKKIDFKIKIGYVLILLFFISCFFIPQLDFIMHAFHVPNDLPYRYSFLYCFTMVLIGGYAINKIEDVNALLILIIYLFMMIFVSLISKFEIVNISQNMIYFNYIAITIYFISYLIYRFLRKFIVIPLIIIIVTVSVECIITINNNWLVDQSVSYFYHDYDKMEEVINKIKKDDKEVYRIERKNLLTHSDPTWYGYYGLTGFSSMEYENVAILHNKLGIAGNSINSYYYKKNTPIYDMMFNLKYYLDNSYDDIPVSSNKYNLGLMFGVNQDIINWNLDSNDIDNQNNFLEKASGISNVLEYVDDIDNELYYKSNSGTLIKYNIARPGKYYLLLDNTLINYIYVNNTMYYTNNDYIIPEYLAANNPVLYEYNENYIIEFFVEDITDLYIEYNVAENLLLYRLNEEKMQEAFDILSSNKVKVNAFKEDNITGTVNLKNDLVIYTSIPYDKGWNVFVDNVKVDTFKIGDALLGFSMPSGKHTIVLKYYALYKDIGLVISILSFASLVLIQCKKVKKDKKI